MRWNSGKKLLAAFGAAGVTLAATVSCNPRSGTFGLLRFDDHHDGGFFEVLIEDDFYDDCFLGLCDDDYYYEEIVVVDF